MFRLKVRHLLVLLLIFVCSSLYFLIGSPHPELLTGAARKGGERLAYVTYLSSTIKRPAGSDDNDRFFVCARILVWQLLHAPATRTTRGLPVLVLVDPGVSASKVNRLRRDGAEVRVVEHVRPTTTDWLKPGKPRWKDVMTKFRLFELEDYDRVLFIDSDTVLQRPLDGVFDEPSTQIQSTRTHLGTAAASRDDEAPVPPTYAMAGVLEVPRNHSYPPRDDEFYSHRVINAGFFVAAPSPALFRHYTSVLDIPERFDSELPEQGLLNYVHRLDGPMPFQRLDNAWNIRNPNAADLKGGVASVHEKWWKAREFRLDPMIEEQFDRVRWTMQGFYEGRDAR